MAASILLQSIYGYETQLASPSKAAMVIFLFKFMEILINKFIKIAIVEIYTY